MKFYKVITKYETELEDGTLQKDEFPMFLTEDELESKYYESFAEFACECDSEVTSFTVTEISPKEFGEQFMNRIIDNIIPKIYFQSLSPSKQSFSEYMKFRRQPHFKELSLKFFVDMYDLYASYIEELDLSQTTVEELFEMINKVYHNRLTEECKSLYN